LRKHIRIVFIVVCSLLWSVYPTTGAANEKSGQLRRAMADLSLLNNQLQERKAEAEKIRGALYSQLKLIQTEARNEIRKANIEDKNEALQKPRIFYDLMLIAEIQAYLERYKKKIGFYRVACDRLSYLYQRADDDLKIVNTLSGMKVEALVSQANLLNEAYLSEAQTILIRPELIAPQPPADVWEKLMNSR
jgi:hypothetical protein